MKFLVNVNTSFFQPSDKLPQGIKDLFVEVKVQDQGLYDLYVQRNHSHYENLWNEDYSDENERLNGWLASVKVRVTLFMTFFVLLFREVMLL